MQNRKDFRAEQAFEQLAWKEMSKLLDQEMPIKEKKRRSPVYFWAAGIAAILVVVFWFSKPIVEEPVSQDILRTETPSIVIEDMAGMSDNLLLNEGVVTEKNVQVQNEILPKKQKNISVNNAKKSIPKPIQSQESNKNIITFNNSELIIDIKAAEEVKSIQLSAAQTSDLIAHENNISNEPVAIHPIWNTPSVQILDIQKISLTSSSDLPRITVPLAKKSTSNFAIQAGYGTNFRQRLNYHIGLDWQMCINRKWSFVTGFQYRYFSNNNISNADFSNLELDDNTLFGGASPNTMDTNNNIETEVSTTTTAPNTILINPNSFDKTALVVPLNMRYHINEKWDISAGFRAAYLFQKIDFASPNNTGVLTNSFTTLNLKLINTIELWSNVGVQFYPTPKWGIGLHYNRSWTPLDRAFSGDVSVSVSEKNNFNHFFETSVSYRF